jgi:hypothetical protein
MATITAVYLDDLGRIRITATGLEANVSHRLQRSTATDPTWVDVRGGGDMGTLGVTVVDDYEYTPNVENFYRLLAPIFFDSFQRDYPSGGTLALTGVAGSYASTPDTASLDLTGDFDMRADLTTTWSGPQQTIMSKWTSTGSQRSYMFTIEPTGRLRVHRTGDGSTVTGLTSTIAVPITTGRLSVRVTLDVNNGAGGHTATFYYGYGGVTGNWIQLGAPVIVAGTITNFSGSAPLEVGTFNGGLSGMLTGQVHAAQLRSSIAGVVVANPNFAAQPAGTGSFVDSTGKTWTVQAGASIITIAPVPGTSWGVADTGETWNVGDTAAGYQAYVDSGVGVIASTTPAGRVGEMYTDAIPGAEDAEITWSALYPDTANLLDAPVEYGVGLRASDDDNAYESNIRFLPSAFGYAVDLRIGKMVADVYTELGDTGVIGTWIPGRPWHVRFRVQGSTLSARAWQDGTDEPAAWDLVVTDASLVAGNRVYVRAYKDSGAYYRQWFGPMEAHTIPPTVGATASVTPMQDGVFLKSVAYPLFNRELECVDWDAISRDARVGLYDVKGRHEILAVTDVGSSGSFGITFVTRSAAENRAVLALLTYGGVMYLQPPGDNEDEDCPDDYSGIPTGYVVQTGNVQPHSMRGQRIWVWELGLTQVAASDTEEILPATITWELLWAILGEDGTWIDLWALWSTWQELWLTAGDPTQFGAG